MLILLKLGRSLRSEIIMIAIVGWDGGEIRLCIETVTFRKDVVRDNFDFHLLQVSVVNKQLPISEQG
jgi:hypothetical protein